jgi:head-tail adaptor
MGYRKLLNKTCTIQTRTLDYTTNEDGTVIETWANTYTNIPCTIQKNSGTLEEIMAGQNKKSTHTLFLLTGQAIADGNRVVISSDTYYVEDYEDAAERGHHIEAQVRKMDV